MPEKKMWVKWDDGADLSQSRKEPGDYSPLTRDGDRNLGQVTLRDIDDNEDEDGQNAELKAALVVLAALAAVVAAYKAAPFVKRWWDEQATPFLKQSRRRFAKNDRATALESPADESASTQLAATESSHEVFAALAEYKASMSSAEARERFVAALVTRLYSDEQLRVLRDARIVDDGGEGLAVLSASMEQLTPEQLGEYLTLMLEENPSWPDEEALAELVRLAVPDSDGKGGRELLPLDTERVERAIRRLGD